MLYLSLDLTATLHRAKQFPYVVVELLGPRRGEFKFYSINYPKKLTEKSEFVVILIMIRSLSRKQGIIAFHLNIYLESFGVFHGQEVIQKLLLDDCLGVVKGPDGIRTLFLSSCHSFGYLDILP